MPDVAVVAHARKSFGGGLRELRQVLAREGVTDPLWYEVNKSRHAPAERSPFVEVTRGAKVKVRFGRKIPYELDGGARTPGRELRIKACPGSVTICVPAQAAAASGGGSA
jgi:hypothetical protein